MPRRRLRHGEEELKPAGSLLATHSEPQEADRMPLRPAGQAEALMQLQRTRGNRYVQRVLDGAQPGAVQRAASGAEESALLTAPKENPNAMQDTEKEARVVMQTGLFALLKQEARKEQTAQPPSEQSIKATIANYVKHRLKSEPAEFEFKDERNRLTRGENKPEALNEKIEDELRTRVKPVKGWHLFGLSIMDAERSVLLAIDNRNPSAQRVYWMDRVEGGFKDVTGRLDERVTQVTRDLWLAQPPDRRKRTRVSVWSFVPA